MALLAATPPHVCRLITSMRGSMSAVLHAPFTYHYPLSIAHLSLWSTELGIYKELRPLHYTCSLAFKGEKNVQNVPIQRDCVPFNNTHYFSAQYLHKAYSTHKYKKYIMVTTYYPCIVKSLCKVSTPCMPSYVTQQKCIELPPRFGDPRSTEGPRRQEGGLCHTMETPTKQEQVRLATKGN